MSKDDQLAKNILFKLREKQAKEFEIFGQRMYQELHNSFLSLQEKLIKNELENDNESLQVKDFYKEMFGENEKKPCECKEQINVQLQLINTLKTRIEALETDTIIKDQDIMKLQQETTDLREYIQSIYDNIDKPTGRNSFDGYASQSIYAKPNKRKEGYNHRFYDLENSTASQDIKTNNRYYDLEDSSASQEIKTSKTSTSSINNDDITPELTDQFNEQLTMDSYTDYYEEMFENNEIEENSFKEYSTLGNARIIDDLNSVQYPPHIKRPNPALNSNAEPGKFKYDRNFLMQFKGVCKEKPENLPDIPTQVFGMEEPNYEKKTRRSSHNKGSPDQSQVTPVIELKFSPMTSEERSFLTSSMNVRNETSSTTTSPPERSTTRTRRSRRKSKQEVTSPERSENRWDPASPKATEVFIPIEIVQREVQTLLNKLTLEKFDSVSDEIIEYANKSRDERDGRILREVIRLIFEKSCEESNSCAMYAQLCRRMMERLDPEIVDENVKNNEGKIVQGGTLFRKYLLNRCQETFEKGWKPSNEKKEPVLTFNEAVKAKRQGLGLIRFISELFKVSMITERIMHECIKRLIGSVEEEEMSSLCAIMNTVGKQLDHDQPNHLMDSYFARIEEKLKLPNLSSRIKSMIKDVIDLRNDSWKSLNAPKTIEQSKDDGWSTVGEGSSKKNKEKGADLTKFGSVNRSKISGNVSLAPGGILGGGAKGWNRSDNKEKNSLGQTNMYSVLTKRKNQL